MSTEKHLNNCWTIYTKGVEDGNKFCEVGRPQDWGDSRWMYSVFTVIASIKGIEYHNLVHIWHEGIIPDHQLLSESGGLLVMFMEPGYPLQYSTREFLHEDDFWEPEWGKMPEIMEEDWLASDDM